MPHRMLQQAIDLMREGKTDAAARMLQVVIKNPDLPSNFRATAYAWLAETSDDLNFKINCLNRALDSDPNNQQIQDRLNGLLAVQPTPPNQPAQRPTSLPNQPSQPQTFQRPNYELPDSQPIDVIKPDMSDSQPIQPYPPQQRPTSMPNQDLPSVRPQRDPHMGPNPYSQVPTFDPQNQEFATGSQPAINMPNLSDSQAMYPLNQQNMPQPQAQSRYRLQQTPRVLGIRQGPNGVGTGVFVTADGIIATTRYVVGSSQQMTVELDTGQELPATVIRSYPQYDLALLRVNVTLERVWPPTQVPILPDNETFIALNYNGAANRGYKRKSKNQLESYWIQTNIDTAQIPNAGGDAMFDNQNYLIGILTRNASRETGLAYGLHILHIYNLVNQYQQESQQIPNAGYCTHCGSLTRAQQFGGFYCETCGAILPSLDDTHLHYQSTPQLLRVYNENLSRPCPNCTAKVGFHDGKCLRCGYDLDSRLR